MLNTAELCPTAQRIAKEFCGNDDVVRALGEMIESKRLPHAFIIEGADGLGKSTFARIIARGAMCACSEPLSGECEHCRKNRESIHPDLMVVSGSGKINAISIESVRSMRKDAMIAPNEAEKRVFILENCDNMLPAAQNAFLKIFEEAPSHVVFIMTCRSAMNLLTTIRSRGRIITLNPVDIQVGAAFIANIIHIGDMQSASGALTMSGGNIGEALRLLGSVSASQAAEKAAGTANEIIEAMCSGSELDLAVKCAAIGKDRALGGAVCSILCERLRCALMTAVGAQDTLDSPDQSILRLGATLSPEVIMQQIDEINELSDMLRINISMPLFNTRLAIILQRRK